MNPVNWFEIPATNIQQAKGFYEAVFNIEMTINEMGGSLMAWFPGNPGQPGATGTLIQGEGYVPSMEGSMVYFAVENIEATLGIIAQNGGEPLTPKISIGEFGFIAMFKDNQGNRVSLHSQN